MVKPSIQLPKDIAKLTIKYSQILRKSISGKIDHEHECLMIKVRASLEDIKAACQEIIGASSNKSAHKLLEKIDRELELLGRKFRKGYEERNEDLLSEEGFDEVIEEYGGYDEEEGDDELFDEDEYEDDEDEQ